MHCSDAAKISCVCQFRHTRIFSFAPIFTCRELAGNKCTVVTQPKSRASASSATPAYSILLLIFTCRELTGNKCTVLSPRDSCGTRNYLLAVAHIISTAAPLLTSLYLPQAALSRKATSSAILAY